MITDRFKLPVGVFIMLRKDNQVALQLRQNCSFAGSYGFIGGHLDGGESIIACAIREAKEEVGIDIRPKDLTLKLICHSNLGTEYLQFYYECRVWQGTVQNMEPHKCEQIEWYDWDKLPVNTCPYLKPAVDNINKGVPFDDKYDIT